MSKQLTMMVGVAMFAALALALAGALSIFSFSASQPVSAQTDQRPTSLRSFGEPQVADRRDCGCGCDDHSYATSILLSLADVTETLPEGWEYESHEPSNVGVKVDETESRQMISFTIFGPTSVTYTVSAPDMAESGTFSGTAIVTRDPIGVDPSTETVGGDTVVTVGTVTPEPGTPEAAVLPIRRAGLSSSSPPRWPEPLCRLLLRLRPMQR